jgi:hypothetical protein
MNLNVHELDTILQLFQFGVAHGIELAEEDRALVEKIRAHVTEKTPDPHQTLDTIKAMGVDFREHEAGRLLDEMGLHQGGS